MTGAIRAFLLIQHTSIQIAESGMPPEGVAVAHVARGRLVHPASMVR